MKNTKRSAFTIVELVIVIAVIAILSAVLIPTFGAIIKDANIAADQAAAATLTSEFHVHLKGNTIDSEEELMTELEESGIGEKLVPKSLVYGYHFWFDIENQMFIANNADGIQALVAERENGTSGQDDSGEGAQSTAAVLTASANAKTYPPSMRHIYGGGFFLVDSAAVLNQMFGNFADITESNYDDYFTNLNNKIDDEDYGAIAAKVLENLKSTVVINNNGVFFYTGEKTATEETFFFAPDVKIVSAKHYSYSGSGDPTPSTAALPTPSDTLTIPSSVILVEEGALNFATANTVEIKTTHANYTELSKILSPNCSNALFLDTAGLKYIVTNETRDGETVGVLHQYFDAETTEYRCDLLKRVPFDNYTLGSAETTGLVEWGGNAGEDLTLYVAITQSEKVTFYLEDAVTHEKSYATVNKWVSDNNQISISAAGVLSFNAATLTDCTASITAETYNINGESKPIQFNVEVVKPTSANVVIDGITYALATDGSTDAQVVTIDYISADTEYEVALSGDISYSNANHKLGSGKITVTTGANSVLVMGANGKAKLDLSKSDYTFSIAIDGCLSTNFKINVIDFEKAAFENNFHYDKHQARPYYVGGKDSVPLSALFTLKEGMDFETATVTIYDRTEGKTFAHVNEINNTVNGIAATYNPETFTADEWEDQVIKFTGNRDYYKNPAAPGIENTVVFNVWVEIVTDNNYATYVQLIIAENAINALGDNFASLNGTVTSDVVLHGDVSSVANTTKIDLGAHTLYGNGYKINATTYRPTTGVVNDYFIKVNGGTIDNIYLNGPVYPWFDYETATNRTHVAGVRTEGESTIQHSYLSGFRSPAMCFSGELTVDNTTLKGGNYGNLVLVEGTLNINDVTTIQDQNGTPDTFNQGKRITGLGIVVDKTAVDGDLEKAYVNITGYLDQYNWIERNQTADLPVVNGIDAKTVFGMLFGVDITIQHKEYYIAGDWVDYKRIQRNINFVNDYIHTVGDKQYVNPAIVFIAMGQKSVIDPLYEHDENINTDNKMANILVNDGRDTTNSSGYISPRTLTPQPLPQFSELPIEAAGLSVKASGLMEIIPDLEEENGRKYYRLSISRASQLFNALKIFSSTDKDVGMTIWSYKNGVTLDSNGYPIEWEAGYYYNYGVTETN